MSELRLSAEQAAAPAQAAEAPAAEASPPPTGELIAGKFKSVDELTKAYKSLEQKLHERQPPPPEPTPPIEADVVLERAGLRGDDLVANWQSDGRLSDEQYESLAKIGYSRSIVDQYLAGQTAIVANKVNAAQAAANRAIAAAGGPEQWNALTEWARTNYDAKALADFDARLADPKTSDSAVKELLWDYRVVAGKGVSTSMISGTSAPATSAAFGTVEEVVEAMAKIRRGGRVDESTKRRLMATPHHLFRGINK